MTDSKPYFVMDIYLEMKVCDALRLGLEMAKDKYPHLAETMRNTLNQYRDELETFRGSEKKPQCKPAYGAGGFLGGPPSLSKGKKKII